ncbi:hypothetical protein M422DRAFT_268387 [Sphaerobolus stellatus SS14]|uniref:Unplaced genomic scaffold SPHSTscaffold_193, whole genome shotgun sequence n=1 Tax=Sphaerobolus stellatus (strain SS14) TaxID=990650 RepID=A0A0C9UXN6_SPHS4|nr:hypothetical protein M422DRAFT_268387 [Sphaerobolus stellatus SS14]
MDIAKDLIDLVNHVSGIPALQRTCSLATEILITGQRSKENTADIQYLAHLIATTLVEISKHTQGRYEDLPPLLPQINQDSILDDIKTFCVKYSSSSPFRALLNASDRQAEMQQLRERLNDVRVSILIALGVEAARSSNTISETQAPLIAALSVTKEDAASDPDLQLYTPSDIFLLQRLYEYKLLRISDVENAIQITLDTAKRLIDGQICVVKSYQGPKSSFKEHEIKKDITLRKQFRNPSFVQLIGASKYTAPLPFQVYNAPESVEPIRTWMGRTLASNPVETLCGLYDMRKSLISIQEFESTASLDGDLGNNLLVSVHQNGSRYIWRAVYAGELSTVARKQSFEIYTRIATNTIVPHWFDPTQKYQDFFQDIRSPDAIADHFCRGSFYSDWRDESRNLEDLMRCKYAEINLQMLETTFTENAWFAPRKAWILPGTFLRLGDIGYVTKDGNFETLANIHNYPAAILDSNNDIRQEEGNPVDEWSCSYEFTGGAALNEPVEHRTRANETYRETSYQATFPSREYVFLNLRYTKLDQKGLLKRFRECAPDIIAQSGLSIAPHSLKLVIKTQYEWWLTLEAVSLFETLPDSLYSGRQGYPQGTLSHHAMPQPIVVDKVQHPLCVLIREGGLDVDERGIPGVKEPVVKLALQQNLEDTTWDPNYGNDITAVKDEDVRVSLEYARYQNMHYLQLPFNFSEVQDPYVAQ